MSIPKFASTDHFEYKTWALALRERLTEVSEALSASLADEAERDVLSKALAAAESEFATLSEAVSSLPQNLSATLAKSTSRISGELKDEISRARSKLKS